MYSSVIDEIPDGFGRTDARFERYGANYEMEKINRALVGALI